MKAPLGLTFCDPNQVLKELTVKPGSVVADFGAGSGYFSFAFAQAVGNEGKVYALDVLPSALEAIESRAKTLGVKNVTIQRVNLERENGSGLGMGMVDWVVMKDVLMQNENKEVILREATRILKSTGRVLIIEWDPKETSVGPERASRITPDSMRNLLEATGLSVESEPNVGGYHYAFLVKKV
ncbi:MAG: methyltransferase domain-containing protein [Candidatus Moraniibacteriota bacterium]